MARLPEYWLDDVAQQLVGAFLLAGPFVVTEEVWRLSRNMGPVQVGTAVGIVLVLGYLSLYKAKERDISIERHILGVPVRYIALITISYGAVALLSLLVAAPETFNTTPWTTAKAIAVGAVFAVIGASTADSLF